MNGEDAEEAEKMKVVALCNGATFIDDCDFEMVSSFEWRVRKYGRCAYAETVADGKTLYMHRLILGFPDNHTDHVNGNGLDNRRHNLRPCSEAENQRNSRAQRGCLSRFKGVSPQRNRYGRLSTWRAYIRIDGRREWLGTFKTEVAAACL